MKKVCKWSNVERNKRKYQEKKSMDKNMNKIDVELWEGEREN